jgi:hypothetical protein
MFANLEERNPMVQRHSDLTLYVEVVGFKSLGMDKFFHLNYGCKFLFG